ncbi:MAG: sensor histidine kinase [Lachnospiraceae bacterium]
MLDKRFTPITEKILTQSKEEPLSDFLVTFTQNLCYISNYWEVRGVDSFLAIRDNQTNSFIADSYFKGFLIYSLENTQESAKLIQCTQDDMMDYFYKCINEDLYSNPLNPFFEQELFSPINLYDTQIHLQSAYIKDNDFIPSKMLITTNQINRHTGEHVCIREDLVDYTQTIPQGFQYIDLTDAYINLFFISGGRMHGFNINTGTPEYYVTDDYKFIYTKSIDFVDADNHSYSIVAHYELRENFFITNQNLLFGILCSYILIMLFIVWILTTFTNSKNKYFYMMEDYRKNLMNNLAHDLKSPLMSLNGCAENLKENVHTEKREHYAEIIMENAHYMNHLINQTLELSKAEFTNSTSSKTMINLCEIMEELIEKYEPILSKKNIEVSINGSYIVKAQTDEILEALDNLLSNAVKYTKESGTIQISGENKAFRISNDSNESAPEHLDDLWNPFVKGDKSRSNKSGSGLGLSIVKNILDKNNLIGTLTYKNGKFTVTVTQ